jgi:SAM-dependent MidA family methyltransferase
MLADTRPADGLPQPDAASLEHSARVADHIRRRMDRSGGSIGFAEYMHEALYAPGLGYYSAGTAKFGAGGDFVTAPEISPLFGRVLGRQCAGVLRTLPGGEILELGAGTGRLSVELLKALDDAGAKPGRYLILEVSAELADRQRTLIRSEVPGMLPRVEWVERLPRRFTGVVVANEVADALPVERFVKRAGRILQLRVTADGNRFGWCEAPAPGYLERCVLEVEDALPERLPDEYVSEVSTALPGWIGDIAGCLEHGLILLIDYGLPRREYYAPDRSGGWLRCHFRHRVHDDPLILPGIQDLTAWVDFTAVATAAAEAGLRVSGFVTQSRFLLDGGLEQALAGFERLPTAARIEMSRQVRILTLPGEMGEHCKCIGLARGPVPAPDALCIGDRAHSL